MAGMALWGFVTAASTISGLAEVLGSSVSRTLLIGGIAVLLPFPEFAGLPTALPVAGFRELGENSFLRVLGDETFCRIHFQRV